MCGIVGYLGSKPAVPILLEGLRRLEYRGYELRWRNRNRRRRSAPHPEIHRKLDRLEELLAEKALEGSCGIGHTRWATHGSPSHSNAHPHTSTNGTISIVHNGIIENTSAAEEATRGPGGQVPE